MYVYYTLTLWDPFIRSLISIAIKDPNKIRKIKIVQKNEENIRLYLVFSIFQNEILFPFGLIFGTQKKKRENIGELKPV